MLVTGLIVAYGYLIETFMAWYSGNIYEQYLAAQPHVRSLRLMYWALILFNVIVPQVLWSARVRTTFGALFVHLHLRQHRHVAGTLRDRCRQFVARLSCLRRGAGIPRTIWDYAMFAGSIGLFFALLFLFVRVLPMISIFEMRELLHEVRRPRKSPQGIRIRPWRMCQFTV